MNSLSTACGGVLGGRSAECDGHGSGRRRHRSGEFSQPVGVVTDVERRPHGLGTVAVWDDVGQELLPNGESGGEEHDVSPVGHVGAQRHAGRQHATVLATLQQVDGLSALERLITGTRQGLMRGLALDLGAGPANASDGSGLLPRLGSQMVASISAPAGSSSETPTASVKFLTSAQRGWRPSSAWSDCEGWSESSPQRVSCPASCAAWMMIMAAFSLSVLLRRTYRWKGRESSAVSPLRGNSARTRPLASWLVLLSSYRGRTLRLRNLGTIP